MDSNNRAVNGEVAIDFKGDGIYNQRHAPHSPTLGYHAPWRSYNMENKMPEEQVRFSFISMLLLLLLLLFFLLRNRSSNLKIYIYHVNFEKLC